MTTAATTPSAAIQQFSDCLNTGDLEGALALYEPDAVFQPAPGRAALHGRDAIREALAGFFALRGTIVGEIVTVHETGDIALVANRWRLRGTEPGGGVVELAGTSADVLRRRTDGTWGIVVDDPFHSAGRESA